MCFKFDKGILELSKSFEQKMLLKQAYWVYVFHDDGMNQNYFIKT